jgi:hypothetical protein
MPDQGRVELSVMLRARREPVQRAALEAISGLRETALRLGLPETETALGETAERLTAENFSLLVTGRFKNGKSTLINALLGGVTKPTDLGGIAGPLVVDDLPATAVLSSISYADTPSVRVRRTDGSFSEWTFADYLENSTFGGDIYEDERRFREIAQFELGFPARLCAANVTIYDSPGLDENIIRTRLTREAWRRCDSAIIVYGTRALMAESQLADDALIRHDNVHVFVVVNLFDGRQVDDRLRAYVWNKYVRDYLSGPAWAGQDLANHDIYFVNAKMAVEARWGSDEAAERSYHDSGLADFEARLGRFLVNERLPHHLGTYTRRAIALSDRIAQQISQRQAAVNADWEELETRWSGLRPAIAALNSRAERIPGIIDRYRTEAIAELTAGFTVVVASIRADLPRHLDEVTLPTQDRRAFTVWHQQKLAQEAVEAINSFTTQRLSDWTETEAARYMGSLRDRLGRDLSDEIADIGLQLDALNTALTGWDGTAPGMRGSVPGPTERVLSGLAGLLFGDISAAVSGGVGGWRGSLGGISGALGASWLLIGVLGITSGLVFLPIMAIGAIGASISGSAGLVGRIKKKALDAADEQLRLLPAESSAYIASDLAERFLELTRLVTEEVRAFIEEQTRNLERQIQFSRKGEADKKRESSQLEEAVVDVGRYRKVLEEALGRAAHG